MFWVLSVPWMGVKPRFWDPENVFLSPEKRCPFNSGNTFKDYVEFFFRDQISCPLNGGVPWIEASQERFHCNHVQQSTRHTYRQQQVAPVVSYAAFLLLGTCFFFFFFLTRWLDVIFICKNKNKNMPEELLMGRDHPLSRYRRYYYGHRSQLQMEVKQIPLHISVQSFTITPISFWQSPTTSGMKTRLVQPILNNLSNPILNFMF